MPRSISFYCSDQDTQELTAYALTLGMFLVPPRPGAIVAAPAKVPLCYLSVAPEQELHPFGNPPQYGEIRDPMLSFIRSRFEPPYIMAGHIISSDSPEFARQTAPFFRKLSAWVRKNWTGPPGGFYTGPGAQALVNAGAERVNFVPGTVKLRIVEI